MRKPRLTRNRWEGIRWAVLNLAEEQPEDFAPGLYEKIQAAADYVRDMDRYRHNQHELERRDGPR